MGLDTVAILSPGDMGHAVGGLLRERGLRVLTCLDGRSERTRTLSEKAGIVDVPTMEDLVEHSQILLSITVSEAVPALCMEIASAVRETGTDLLFAECNAIAPQVSREMEPIITGSGARYVDASIVGGPPRNGSSPRFYTSGDHTGELARLKDYGLDVRPVGPEVGQASGIKMCYAAMTKGSSALYAQLLLAAELMGLSDHVKEEFRHSQSAVMQRMERGIPGIPARSRRWVSEMQEIEATFANLGLTHHLFRGVTDMYRLIGGTPLGEETPESRDRERSLEETMQLLAQWVQGNSAETST
jgi:3-hydroxyisobutyrate dehydrogenase-like beta-hydroxyacid dehydrogenase